MAASYVRFVARAAGDSRVVKVEFAAAAAFTASATDYWTVTVRLRRFKPGTATLQTYGSVVGATYSLATRSLTAGQAVVVYEDPRGLPMKDGEELWATIASVGSPAVLSGPSVVPDIQPITR